MQFRNRKNDPSVTDSRVVIFVVAAARCWPREDTGFWDCPSSWSRWRLLSRCVPIYKFIEPYT